MVPRGGAYQAHILRRSRCGWQTSPQKKSIFEAIEGIPRPLLLSLASIGVVEDPGSLLSAAQVLLKEYKPPEEQLVAICDDTTE